MIWREIGRERLPEFLAAGHRERHFFPHRVLCLPKAGPDGYRLAQRMCGIDAPARHRELVLYADESMLDEFPADLFFDDQIAWHRQQFGVNGQIATGNVVVDGTALWSMVHIADVVQRIGRRRAHKTRIENRFRGWHDMLLNALLALAAERDLEELRLPTATFAMQHTRRNHTVGSELFERIYDRDVQRLYRARRASDWWVLPVDANRDRIVFPHAVEAAKGTRRRRTICVCHDVEAGLGHVGIDDALVHLADRTWRGNLRKMLEIEHELGVRASYNVVGLLLGTVRDEIAAGAHCLAFHSYDHGFTDQLRSCRRIDSRLKGYRAPRSRLTDELEEQPLLHHNFEWLASSVRSLGRTEPALVNGLVKIPVHFDDFKLYRSDLDLTAWQEMAFARIAEHDPVVFCLHDCYAHLWLHGYREFLQQVRALGDLRTLDQLAAEVTVAASE
jgi:hypothetical protein